MISPIWNKLSGSYRGVKLPAVVTDDHSISYADLIQKAESLADRMTLAGIGPGCVAHVFLENSPAVLVVLLACAKIGAAYTPVDVSLKDREISAILALTRGSFFIAESGTLPQLGGHAKSWVELSVVGDLVSSRLERVLPSIENEGTGCIQFTSGTTGIPKGILISREAFFFRADNLRISLRLTALDRTLCVVPLSHSHGIDCLALPTLLAGGTLFLKSPQSAFPLHILEEIDRLQISFFSSIPQFYDFAIRMDPESMPTLRSLKHPFCGSAALSAATAVQFFKKYGVHIKQGYGLAEIAVICLNQHEGEQVYYDSVGIPIHGIEWKIAGEDPLNGELVVRSNALFAGYIDAAELTHSKLQDGWLYTGDFVTVDAKGFIRVIGRMEDFVKLGGHKVYLAEIEAALMSLAWIRECAVTSEADESGNEVLIAYLVPAASAALETEHERTTRVLKELRDILSDFKVPGQFKWREALPKSPLGKVLKSHLQES